MPWGETRATEPRYRDYVRALGRARLERARHARQQFAANPGPARRPVSPDELRCVEVQVQQLERAVLRDSNCGAAEHALVRLFPLRVTAGIRLLAAERVHFARRRH